MGFMDKAKKLAEQAQEKLDEAQKNFNPGQGGSQEQADEGGVRYDEHGRPIQTETPAAATPPPAAAPVEGATGGPPSAAPEDAREEAPEEARAAPPPAPEQSQGSGGANATPDPFKPLQQ